MVIQALVKRNTYFDSITLMKVARTLTDREGVEMEIKDRYRQKMSG